MKTRKFLALVLAVAMLATIFVLPSAAVTAGEACEILGLLKGDGDGVTAEYLAKPTTRAQGLMITLRARGLDTAAEEFDGEDNFDDFDDVSEYWAPVLAYAKANPELGWIGDGDGNFRPAAVMSGAEVAKVMLALLGYDQEVDFEWDDIEEFAASVGVTVPAGAVTNDDLAASLVEVLQLETVDGDILIDALIADEVVDEEDAIAAGLVTEEEEPAVDSIVVEVKGVKTIKVTFAEAQDTDKVKFSLRKGLIGQAVTATWDTAKKVATLDKATKFTKGDYELKVDEQAFALTIDADETATALVLNKATLFRRAAAQDIQLHLLNQYGEKMLLTDVVVIVSLGERTIESNTVKVKLPSDFPVTGLPASGTEVTVVAVHAASNMSINKVMTIIDDQVISEIKFSGDVKMTDANVKKYAGRLTEGTTGNILGWAAYDQYGNAMDTKADISLNETTGNVRLILAGAKNATNGVKGELKFDINEKATTIQIKAISLETGNVSDWYIEDVYALPELAGFELEVPELFYEGEEGTVTAYGVDQYGEPIDIVATDIAEWQVNVSGGYNATAELKNKAINSVYKNEVRLTFAKGANPKSEDPVTVNMTFVKGTAMASRSVLLAAEKKIVKLAGTSLAATGILVGKTIEFKYSSAVFHTQYGEAAGAGLKNALIADGWKWELFAKDGAGVNIEIDSTAGSATGTTWYIKANDTGLTANTKAETFELRYYKGDSFASATDTQKFKVDVAFTAVKPAAIKGYELVVKNSSGVVVDTMYAGETAKAGYNLNVTLLGTIDKLKVALEDHDVGSLPTLEGKLYHTWSASNRANFATATNTIVSVDSVWAASVNQDSATLKIWNDKAVVVAEKTITFMKEAPKAVTLTIALNNTTRKVVPTVIDQYNVKNLVTVAGKYYSADATKITIATDGTLTGNGADTTKEGEGIVRFVSDDGVWLVEKLIHYMPH